MFLANNFVGQMFRPKKRGNGILKRIKKCSFHLMKNGHIVRLEFKKPITNWIEPVFYEKSVQIDFPGAFVSLQKRVFLREFFNKKVFPVSLK
ncbi:MAG: hypothetical protein CM1200mP16_10770 [Nitrospina sp.]|nr:MAG: hypothetical protein CM1200mP16_10770 [Nitrospina sp.]